MRNKKQTIKRKKGFFGIAVWDREKNDYYVETQDDLYDKENAKSFFDKLMEKRLETIRTIKVDAEEELHGDRNQ